MTFQAGDWVVAETESTECPARYGTVREVVREDPRPLSHRVGRRARACTPAFHGGAGHERRSSIGPSSVTRPRERALAASGKLEVIGTSRV